jgi:queuosine precursor transporter
MKWAWGAVLTGAVLSGLLDPALAFASAAAFLLAESLDLLVYTPLQRRNLFVAVIASNIVGIAVDSFVFLYLAGIPLMFIEGQIIGKFYMTLLALPIIWWIRRRDLRSGLVVTPNGQTVWPDEPLTA